MNKDNSLQLSLSNAFKNSAASVGMSTYLTLATAAGMNYKIPTLLLMLLSAVTAFNWYLTFNRFGKELAKDPTSKTPHPSPEKNS